MKKLKFLFVGMLVLGFAGAAFSQEVPTACTGSGMNVELTPSNLKYVHGQTVEYVIDIDVGASACDACDVDVYFFPPSVTPDGATSCLSSNGIPIVTGQYIAQGGSLQLTSSDDANLAYIVAHADENMSGQIFAYVCVTFVARTDPVLPDDSSRSSVNSVVHPCINVVKEAEPNAICEGNPTDVDYTYTVTNCGDVDLENITIEDDTCSGITEPTGDDLSDGILGETEVWTYDCNTIISEETTNRVDVNGQDVETGTVVDDNDVLTVVENPPPGVSVDPPDATICDDNSVEFCAVVTGGAPPYTYLWSTGETTECITVSEANEYCVTVTDSSGCEDTNCAVLTVNPTPSCDINEPASPPECDSIDNTLSADVTGGTPAYTYSWTSSDDVNWPITAGAATDTITYDAGPPGTGTTFTLEIIDDEGCMTDCELFVTCGVPPGDMYCTFTQGFWGNANGKFEGETTEDILIDYFAAKTLTIGAGSNKLTLSSASCLLKRMPAGGKPRCLKNLGVRSDTCSSSTPSWLRPWVKKENRNNNKGGRYNNTLMGQIIALSLNMWVDPNLGSLPLSSLEGGFCTQGEDPEDWQCFDFPDSLAPADVNGLLGLANSVLGCDNGASISDIYEAVTAINEGFDECRTLVPCDEVCDDEIDNDCDGDIDCEDSDCDCPS